MKHLMKAFLLVLLGVMGLTSIGTASFAASEYSQIKHTRRIQTGDFGTNAYLCGLHLEWMDESHSQLIIEGIYNSTRQLQCGAQGQLVVFNCSGNGTSCSRLVGKYTHVIKSLPDGNLFTYFKDSNGTISGEVKYHYIRQ